MGSSLGHPVVAVGYLGMSRRYPWANRGAIVWMRGIALAVVAVRARVRLPFVACRGRWALPGCAGLCRAIVGYTVAILWLSQGYLSIHHG